MTSKRLSEFRARCSIKVLGLWLTEPKSTTLGDCDPINPVVGDGVGRGLVGEMTTGGAFASEPADQCGADAPSRAGDNDGLPENPDIFSLPGFERLEQLLRRELVGDEHVDEAALEEALDRLDLAIASDDPDDAASSSIPQR
jgi:hypothetical protein